MAQRVALRQPQLNPPASIEVGVTSRTVGVPCLVPALRNDHLHKDFKGPRKITNYTVAQPPDAWIESYELAMEMLDVNDVVCAKYFTMMLDGPART